jgi:hypothetical protein
MEDRDFWLVLEYGMSGRLTESPNKEWRRYWIDGFIPESITDTKTGVEVIGDVWVAEHKGAQTKCRFLARIPQKLLHRKIREFDYKIAVLDVKRKYVELDIMNRTPDE